MATKAKNPYFDEEYPGDNEPDVVEQHRPDMPYQDTDEPDVVEPRRVEQNRPPMEQPEDTEPDVTPPLEQQMPPMEQPQDNEPDVIENPRKPGITVPPTEYPEDNEPDVTEPYNPYEEKEKNSGNDNYEVDRGYGNTPPKEEPSNTPPENVAPTPSPAPIQGAQPVGTTTPSVEMNPAVISVEENPGAKSIVSWKNNKVGDMMNNVFGNSYLMTPEEQQRRIKRARTRALIGNLGQAMSAFVQIPFVNAGGTPVNVKPISTYEDEMRFIDRVNAARKEAYLQQRANEDKARSFKLQQDRLELDRQKEKRTQDWYDFRVWKDTAEIEIKQGKLDLAQKKLELDRMVAEGKISRMEAQNTYERLKIGVEQQNAETRAQQAQNGQFKKVAVYDEMGNKVGERYIKVGEQEEPPKGGGGNKQKTKLEW